MRNFFKPTTRGANARSRRPLRGVAAAVASVALVAGLGSYSGDAVAQETTTKANPAATTTAEPSAEALPRPKTTSADGVTVERSGDIDTIVVDDSDVNVWDSGRKASDEDIIALKRTGQGTIEEIIKIVADGKELDPQYYGFVNDDNGGYIAVDMDGLDVIPPMNIEFEVRTTEGAEYDIAESDEVPTARELSKSGFGQTENAAATVNPDGVGMARAAAPGEIWNQPGVMDQEFSLTNPEANWVNNNPELKFTVNETGNWRMTRFAVKKDRNDSNTKSITGPVRIRVIRQGRVVTDRTFDDLYQNAWQRNAKGSAFDTEFQLLPRYDDLYLNGGDTVILNPVGPSNGTYSVQMWGQDLSNQSQDHKVNVIGQGIPLTAPTTVGKNPYETTFNIKARSYFKSASVVLSPAVRLEDVALLLPTEATDEGVQLEHEVKRYSDRVEITWFPTKNGVRIDSVTIPQDTTVTLKTSYRSSPTRPEDVVVTGSLAPEDETRPRLPIAPIEERGVPPITPDSQRCTYRDTKPVSRQPARGLSALEEEFGFRRYIVASPVSSEERASSQLYLQTDEDNDHRIHTEVGPKQGWVYNALAYNEKDNYLYAISQGRYRTTEGYRDDPCFPAGHLLQINPLTGEVFDLGKVTGFQGQLPENLRDTNRYANDLGSGINSGTFDQEGNYWVSASSSRGSGRLYKVDLNRLTATSKSSLAPNVPWETKWTEKQHYRTASEDIVSLPEAPNYLWGIQSTWASGTDKVYLERTSLTGEDNHRIDITNLEVPGTGQTVKQFFKIENGRFGVFGQAWLEPDGTIAFGLGGGSVPSGQREAQGIRIKVTNPGEKRERDIGVEVVGSQWAPVSYNTDAASALAPTTPPTKIYPTVEKQAIDKAEPQADGSFIAKYRITVTNPDAKRGASYGRVVDTPRMPAGVNVVGATWTLTNEFGKTSEATTQPGPGPFLLADFGDINAKGVKSFGAESTGQHTFDVEIRMRIDDGASLPTGDECTPQKSLYNLVEVGPNKDEACIPPPKTSETKLNIRLAKVSSEKLKAENVLEQANLLKDAEFTVTPISSEGEPSGMPVAMVFNSATGTFDATELKPGRYRLAETKAPAGFSLLTAPIDFTIATDAQSGTATIVFDADEAGLVAQQVENGKAPNSWNLTKKDAILTLANVHQGDLPKTGGRGVGVTTALGLLIAAAGALMANSRRRV